MVGFCSLCIESHALGFGLGSGFGGWDLGFGVWDLGFEV